MVLYPTLLLTQWSWPWLYFLTSNGECLFFIILHESNSQLLLPASGPGAWSAHGFSSTLCFVFWFLETFILFNLIKRHIFCFNLLFINYYYTFRDKQGPQSITFHASLIGNSANFMKWILEIKGLEEWEGIMEKGLIALIGRIRSLQ